MSLKSNLNSRQMSFHHNNLNKENIQKNIPTFNNKNIVRETYPQEKVTQKPPKPIKKNYSTEHLLIPKTNNYAHKTISHDTVQYERTNYSRQNSYQDSKNKVVENCQLLKLDSNRPCSSTQKESLNNSKYSNSSAQKGQNYLDRRHYETMERLNKLRIEKLKNEESELKDKPSISRNSQKICERLRNNGNSLEKNKGHTEHYCREIENTINNMKKELYDTYENDKEILRNNTKINNTINNYSKNLEKNYKQRNDSQKEINNHKTNPNESKLLKTNYSRSNNPTSRHSPMRTNNNISSISNEKKYETLEPQDIVNVFSPIGNASNKIPFSKANTKMEVSKKEMNQVYNDKPNPVKIDINNITKMENTKLDYFNNFDMFSPPNRADDSNNINLKEKYSTYNYKTNDKNINNFNKNYGIPNKQSEQNQEKNLIYKPQYNSNQINVQFNLFNDRTGDENHKVTQKNNEDRENLDIYQQRLNHIKCNSDANDKKSKSLNYNVINKSNKSIESNGQKRKEALENIKDYLEKIEKTSNNIKKTNELNYYECTQNNVNNNIEPEKKRMKLNDVSKKFLIDKMQEITHKQTYLDINKVNYHNGLMNKKNINPNYIYKK